MIDAEEILEDIWQVEISYNKWVDLAILFGVVILYRFIFLIIAKISEKIKPGVRAFARRSPRQIAQVDIEAPSI